MFVHPFLLMIGLAAASLPIIIHFLTRPKPIRMPLSTIGLVSDALHQRRAKDRLRDFLVLLLRSLALALLAVAIARPLLTGDASPSDEEPAERVMVVLLDASQSMAAIEGQTTRFDKARAAAAKVLKYQSGLAANLLVASHRSGQVFDVPSANLGLLRERLADATVSAAGIDVAKALEEATRQFASSNVEAVRELVILSDFQRTSWARADFSTLPTDTEVRLVSIASAGTLANLAIEQVRFSSSPTVGKPVTVLVDVANHSDDTRPVKCQLKLTSITQVAQVTVQAHSTGVIQMSVDWPAAGWQTGNVHLIDTGDAIAADDVYPIAIDVRPELRVAIVTEAGNRSSSGAFFVSQVLSRRSIDDGRDVDRSDGKNRLVTITPSMLDTPPAQVAELWIVTDVEAWDDSVVPQMASWLRRGKSMLYIARGPADANHLKQLHQHLGAEMQPPVELIASLDSDRRQDLRIEHLDERNPPFNAFGDSLTATVANWRFAGGLPTRTLGTTRVDAVAATLSDRSALLYFTEVGAGHLAVLNADLSRSNIAYQAGFVPMLVETINRLTDVGGAITSTFSGQPIFRELPLDAGSLEDLSVVRDGDENESEGINDEAHQTGRISEQNGMPVWSWPAATVPGVYWVIDPDENKVWAEAVRSDPTQQDLRLLSEEVLLSRLSGGRQMSFQSSVASRGQEDSLWVWAALAMLGCVVGELATLFSFRS